MECPSPRIVSLLVPLITVACNQAGTVGYGTAAERQAILEVLEVYYSDFSGRDWDAFSNHFWPGADMTTVWQPPGETADRVVPTTIEEFVSQAPQGPDSREIFEERMLDAEVRVFNNLAQAWVRYGMRFGDPDSVQYWEGIDAFTLLKHDDTWRIASLVFTNDTAGEGN